MDILNTEKFFIVYLKFKFILYFYLLNLATLPESEI